MGKLFIRLAGSITETAVNLDNISLELNVDNITFANTVEIKKKLNKTELQLNKIINSIQNSNFNDLETDKLQQALAVESEKLEQLKNKLEKLQRTINHEDYTKKRDELFKLLKKINSYADNIIDTWQDPNKNKELLLQLKIFKKHIKNAEVNNDTTTVEPEINANLTASQPQNSQSKLLSI